MDQEEQDELARRAGVDPIDVTGVTRDETAKCWIVEARGEEHHVPDEPQLPA